MFTDHEISAPEHQAWWESVKADPTKRSLLYLRLGEAVGVVNFFDIDATARTCHWGFYVDSDRRWSAAERLAVWIDVEEAAIEYAFRVLDCDALICETFEFNQHVHQLHRRFGFAETGAFMMDKDGRPERVIVMTLKRNVLPGFSRASGQAEAWQHTSITFLGSANWDLAGQAFARAFRSATETVAEVLPIPFGQYRGQLADSASALRSRLLDYCVFAERLDDLLDSPYGPFDLSQRDAVESRFNDYLATIRAARDVLTGTFLVLDLASARPVSAPLDDATAVAGTPSGYVNDLNARLRDACAALPDCCVVSLSTLVAHVGARQAAPGKYWHLGRIAWSAALSDALANRLVQTILALRGHAARALVIDLDNTIWGGVIGDDGLEGIQLGGDYPGSAYTEIQRTLKSFRDRGIVLAVCSKNTDAIAREALEKHPGMVLRPSDFTVMRINWRDKVENLREIAGELGLGAASLCVIDDSPYERDAIRQLLPGVIVPELPEDRTAWSSVLLDHPYLGSLPLTQEDRERASRYDARARVRAEAAAFDNKEAYWRSLEMRLYFHRLDEGNKQRVLQLLSKTNQFNTTTRRYSEADLKRLAGEGAAIVPVGLSDKYSQHEIVGVVIMRPAAEAGTAAIDTFLLSCRVLGRSVETGVVAWMCGYARSIGCRRVEGQFVPTARNAPASRVYPDHGFAEVGDGRFGLDLERGTIAMPAWFAVSEEVYS